MIARVLSSLTFQVPPFLSILSAPARSRTVLPLQQQVPPAAATGSAVIAAGAAR